MHRRAAYGLIQLRGIPDGASVDLDGLSGRRASGSINGTSFELITPLQVTLGTTDPKSQKSLTAGMLVPAGFTQTDMLIRTLIEPTSVAGFTEPHATHLVFDGEVGQGTGFSFQISPKNFGSPPGHGGGRSGRPIPVTYT